MSLILLSLFLVSGVASPPRVVRVVVFTPLEDIILLLDPEVKLYRGERVDLMCLCCISIFNSKVYTFSKGKIIVRPRS